MICREFERMWNEVLDGPDLAAPAVEQALEEHASACPSCRALSARYQALRQALRAWGPPPVPSAACTDRLVTRLEEATRPKTLRWSAAGRGLVRVAAAATVLAAGLLALRQGLHEERGDRASRSASPPVASRPLTAAVADATLATLDLARSASAPAARVGSEVLGAAAEPSASPELPELLPPPPASAVLHDLSDRINASVRPISGSARHAFGFLLPAPVSDEKPVPGPREGA